MELKGIFLPKTVGEARALLYQYPDSKLLAGGTDLVLGLRREEQRAEYLMK